MLGVDDEQYGQRLAAFVVVEDGALATSDSLKQACAPTPRELQVPREIVILDELPRSNSGKILRNELRARE